MYKDHIGTLMLLNTITSIVLTEKPFSSEGTIPACTEPWMKDRASVWMGNMKARDIPTLSRCRGPGRSP